MLPRNVTRALCLSLVALASLPVSPCSMLAGLPAQCQPRPHCLETGKQEPLTSVEAPGELSCCQLSETPVPQAQDKAPAPQITANVVRDRQMSAAATRPARAHALNAFESASPSDRQPLLCVFLI